MYYSQQLQIFCFCLHPLDFIIIEIRSSIALDAISQTNIITYEQQNVPTKPRIQVPGIQSSFYIENAGLILLSPFTTAGVAAC
jgi:hypothetical protein